MTDTSAARELATLTGDDLVTGEAVALDLPPAGLGSRIASGLIDVTATLTLLVVAIVVFTVTSLGADGALQQVAYLATIITVFIVVPTTIETLTRGRSLGKLAMGLRTVRDDAGPISFQHAFVRALVGVVEIYGLGAVPAFFSSLINRRGKRLGDLAAGTYVVRERFRLELPRPTPMPAHLASWARSADVGSLPTGLALGVRQYLARAGQLDAASRERVGAGLRGQVAPYVAPPPPPETQTTDFLAAVVATRRDRDRARLAREAALRDRLSSRSRGQTPTR